MRYLPSRRSTILLPAAVVLAVLPGTTVAQPQESPAITTNSPFLGRWELDLSRMPRNYGTPPKKVVFAFREVSGGNWHTTIDITAPDGSVRHMAVTYRPDGTMARGEGDTSEADSAAIMIPVRNVLVMNLARNGMPGSVRVYTVTADGREMIESAAAVDDKGAPFVRNFHFTRMR